MKYDKKMAKDVEKLANLGLTNEQIASNMHIALSTFYHWLKIHPEFKDALKIGHDKGIKFAANKLMTLIDQGNLGAIIYYLRCRDKDRWNERVMVEMKTENTHTVISETKLKDISKLTDEQLAEIAYN